MSWQTLNNSISVDITSLFFENGFYSVARYLKNCKDQKNCYNIYDLYPFKIVTLKWLVDSGYFIKAKTNPIPYFSLQTVQANINNPISVPAKDNLLIYQARFLQTDLNFYPLGDVFIDASKENNLNTIPVLLVANDAKILHSLLTIQDLSLNSNIGNNYNLYCDAPSVPNVSFLGMVAVNPTDNLPLSNYAHVYNNYFFVNNLAPPVSVASPNYKDNYFAFGNKFVAILYHYNITVGCYDLVLGNNFQDIQVNPVDIIPDCLMAAKCTSLISKIFPNIPQFLSDILNNVLICSDSVNFMNAFCQGRNVTLEPCYKYCKTDENALCDQNLTDYCSNTSITFTINSGNSYFIDIPFMDEIQIVCQLKDFPNTTFKLNQDYTISQSTLNFLQNASPPIGSQIIVSVNYDISPPDTKNLNASFQFERTCPCFSKPLFNGWYKSTFGPILQNPSTKAWFDQLGLNATCNLPACRQNSDAIQQKSGSKCPDQEIQICVNNQKIVNQGSFQDSPIDLNSFVCCYQQSGAVQGLPKCTNNSQLLSNPFFLYGVGGFVVIAIIIILYKVFKN